MEYGKILKENLIHFHISTLNRLNITFTFQSLYIKCLKVALIRIDESSLRVVDDKLKLKGKE